MAERKAVTKHLARRYERASKKEKGQILASAAIAEEAKEALTRVFLELGRTKPTRRREVKPPPDHPFRSQYLPPEISRTFRVRQPVQSSRTSTRGNMEGELGWRGAPSL